VQTIESVFASKMVNLTPRQRQLYGRVAYETEFWVDKVFDHMKQDTELVPPYIDMEEHASDMVAHRALNQRIARLTGILQSLEDTNRQPGSDLYSNFLAYYRNLREAAKVNAVGASSKYSDLKQQFPDVKKSSDTGRGSVGENALFYRKTVRKRRIRLY
jgi:hypothetical protein